jgi:hypothetical protein
MKKMQIIHMVLAGLFLLGGASCSETDDTVNPKEQEDNSAPTAVITGENEIGTGGVVTLDGSGSSDPDGDELTFSWQLLEKPTASNATLSSSSSVSVEFTADQAGSYKVRLTVSDGTEEDMAEHTMVSEIEVLGDITADRTLIDVMEDPSLPDYRVKSDIDVEAVLTIEPGVVIHADEGNIIEVQSSGALIAQGNETDSIVMTSSNETGDVHWGGLIINSSDSQNQLDYTRVSYAGGNSRLYYRTALGDVFGNIGIREGARLSVTNSVISHSGGFGMHVDYDGTIHNFSNNLFTHNAIAAMQMPVNQFGRVDGQTRLENNGRNSVQAYATHIASGDDQQWNALAGGATYHIIGDVEIHDELSLGDGVQVELDEGVRFEVASSGVLMAEGTETNPIRFTSSDISGGRYWTGMTIRSSDARNVLNHTIVNYAGSPVERQYYRTSLGDVHANIAVMEGARLSVENSTIGHGAAYGIAVDYGASFNGFSSNRLADNQDAPVLIHVNAVHGIDAATEFVNTENYIKIYNNQVTDDQTWVDLNGTTAYRFTWDVQVKSNLVIDAGARLEFDEDVQLTVDSEGSLVAEGTASSPIRFTSSNVAGEVRWAGIDIQSTSALNSFDYVTVNWGGGNERLFYRTFIDSDGDVHANIGLQENAKLSLTNSRILNSGEYGLAILEGATVNGARSETTIYNANTEFNNPDGTDFLIE